MVAIDDCGQASSVERLSVFKKRWAVSLSKIKESTEISLDTDPSEWGRLQELPGNSGQRRFDHPKPIVTDSAGGHGERMRDPQIAAIRCKSQQAPRLDHRNDRWCTRPGMTL